MNNDKSLITYGLVVASSLIALNMFSKTTRKITGYTCKVVCKQNLKLLAGIGVLSIANSIANNINNPTSF